MEGRFLHVRPDSKLNLHDQNRHNSHQSLSGDKCLGKWNEARKTLALVQVFYLR